MSGDRYIELRKIEAIEKLAKELERLNKMLANDRLSIVRVPENTDWDL